MDKIGQALLWSGLLLVAILGIWLFLAARDTGAPPDLSNINPIEALIPQPTTTLYASPAAVLQSVQALSQLETAAYHIEKVITAESSMGSMDFLFGDKLILIAVGKVTAGVDLGEIDHQDIVINPDGSVYMRLPDVQIFHNYLDNSQTRVYDRQTGVVGQNAELESAARTEAESFILEHALEYGIEEDAKKNAKEVLRSFILSMGFTHVVFVNDTLPTPIPTTTPVTAGP